MTIAMLRYAFILLSMIPALIHAQSFDGHTVYWPKEVPAVIDAKTMVFSSLGQFDLQHYQDSVRLQYNAIDTVLVAPWLTPGSTSFRDGIYNLYGIRIGAVASPVPVPGFYIVAYRGKTTLVPKFVP